MGINYEKLEGSWNETQARLKQLINSVIPDESKNLSSLIDDIQELINKAVKVYMN